MVLVLLIQTGCFAVRESLVFAQIRPEKTAALSAYYPEGMSLTGMKLDLSDSLKIKFYLNPPVQVEHGHLSKSGVARQIEYFLAALTIPESRQWVNLSPFENDRIIPEEFGRTRMGQALLQEDRRLKQLTSLLLNPLSRTGRKFWKTLDERLQREYGTADIPLDFSHKVWIVPDRAVFYARGAEVFLTDTHMKVQLDSDLLAEKSLLNANSLTAQEQTRKLFSGLLAEIVLPRIEREINSGQAFVELRRVYQSMALAAWYKRAVSNGGLLLYYRDHAVIEGIEASDALVPEKIFRRYTRDFSEGAFDRVYESYDLRTADILPRKFFSGGWDPGHWSQALLPSSVPPDFLSTQVEVDASMEVFEDQLYSGILRSFRPIENPREIIIDMEGIRIPSVSVWLRCSLWAKTMNLFRSQKSLQIQQDYIRRTQSPQWLAVARMIGRPGNNSSEVYRNEMTMAILAANPRKMNFWTIFQGLLSARLRAAWIARQWDSPAVRVMREFGLDNLQTNKGYPYTAVSMQGKYKDLYRKMHDFFVRKGVYRFLDGEGQRESDFRIGANASSLKKEFSLEQIEQFVQEGVLEKFFAISSEARYINTQKTPDELMVILNKYRKFVVFRQSTFAGRAEVDQFVIFDYLEDYFYILYAGLEPDVPAIMAELEKVWQSIVLPGLSFIERARRLADFEWLFYQVNPLIRGGAALGTAFSVVARIELGIPLPHTFVAQDQIALAQERVKYVEARTREFMEALKTEPVGGIDMNPVGMDMDTVFSRDGVVFYSEDLFPGRIHGLRPVITGIK